MVYQFLIKSIFKINKGNTMLEFKTVRVDLRRSPIDVEEVLPGRSEAGSHWNFQGSATATFSGPVRTVNCAVQSFTFQTREDHHIKKIKLEVGSNPRISGNQVTTGIEAHFGDVSPHDDNYEFMRVTVLFIGDTF